MQQEVLQLAYALDTFYFLICGILIIFMATGFAMLEAGLVRTKNMVEILLKNISLLSLASIGYYILGYQVMYGTPLTSVIPGLDVFLGTEHDPAGITKDTPYSSYAFFFLQVGFVATTVSIVSGAVAERMKLEAFLIFAVFMSIVIYPVSGYWIWGGGFLSELGYFDFAGSGAVHLLGAISAVAALFILGPRIGKYSQGGISQAIPGANLPMTTLGVLILWLGWFGFNGGSQLLVSTPGDANAVAKIMINTNMAACAGAIGALITSRIWFKSVDLTMVLNGALGGLVAITADPVNPSGFTPIGLGLIAGVLVFVAVVFIDKVLKLDDPVGAIAVHGVAGILGVLAVPFSNADASFASQLTGILVILGWGFGMSIVFWLVCDKIFGVRVSRDVELTGLDIHACGQEAYPEFNNKSKTVMD